MENFSEAEILAFLQQHQINYDYLPHPPVYTCEEADRYTAAPGRVGTKNLLLTDRRGRFYLVVTGREQRQNFRALAEILGSAKLSFAPEASMLGLLGVTPGAVSILGLVLDTSHQVDVWVDREVWAGEWFLCHPLVNTASLVIQRSGLERFLSLTGHEIHFFGP